MSSFYAFVCFFSFFSLIDTRHNWSSGKHNKKRDKNYSTPSTEYRVNPCQLVVSHEATGMVDKFHELEPVVLDASLLVCLHRTHVVHAITLVHYLARTELVTGAICCNQSVKGNVGGGIGYRKGE